MSAARALRGEKSQEEQQEEKQARHTMIEFLTKQFARADVKFVASPAPNNTADAKPADPPSSNAAPPGTAETRRAAGNRGMSSERIAGDAKEITRERFTQQLANSPALASRPEIADRAVAARRGGGAAALSGAGREDDTLAVEDSSQGRRISEAMIDYLVAFMHNGKPEIEGKPVWPAFSDTARKAMVFGNHGIASRDFKIR